MTLALPVIPVELTPEEERRARAYIWAIVARMDGSEIELENEAGKLWVEFGERYGALTNGPYSKPNAEALRIALGRL